MEGDHLAADQGPGSTDQSAAANYNAYVEAFNQDIIRKDRRAETSDGARAGVGDGVVNTSAIDSFNDTILGGHPQIRTNENIEIFNMTYVRDSLPNVDNSSVIFQPSIPVKDAEEAYKILLDIDENRISTDRLVKSHISALKVAQLSFDAYAVLACRSDLRNAETELRSLRNKAAMVDAGGHGPVATFRDDLLSNMEADIIRIGDVCSPWTSNAASSSRTLPPNVARYTTGELPIVRMRRMHFMTLVPMLLVIVLSTLGNTSNAYANASLRVLVHFIPMISAGVNGSGDGSPSTSNPLVNLIPKDIRTVKERLKLSPVLLTYAMCPSCSKLHKSTLLSDGYPSFPRECGNVIGGKRPRVCEAILTKDVTVDGEIRSAPLKPYHIQDFNAFKGRLLMDPVLEGLMRLGQKCSEKKDMVDIKDGKRLSSIPGPNGGKFMDSDTDELRLAWNLSADWANPFLNKTAGKHASVGSVGGTCLNLPPLYRYRMDNIYLATVIPGPDEPSVTEIIEYIDVIVDIFLHSYLHGTHFSSTYLHPDGVLERSVISALVCDLPAARKCGGLASCMSSKNMCHLCHMTADDINELDMTKRCWRSRKLEDHVRNATQWRDTIGVGDREALFKKNGVRWSPFYRLPYWNPQDCIVIDGMHNLFLGLVQFHCRSILGISVVSHEESEKMQFDPKMLSKVRKRLEEGNVSAKFAKGLSVHVLEYFCNEFDVDISDISTEDPLAKRALRDALIKGANDKAKGVQKSPESENGAPSVGGSIPDLREVFENAADVFSSRFRELRKLTKKEVNSIRKSIENTQRPRSNKGPPKNLGEKKHGKLKADQWRSAIEFDIPVALAKLCQSAEKEDLKVRQVFFRSTMLLAIAMRYATAYTVSEERIDCYTRYMLAYLKSILEIDPALTLRPNQHNALHLGHYLRLFGPMHGWWMFVFERVIGKLQQTNTNHRIGELERTMLEQFATAGNLKGVLKHPDAGELISNIARLVEGAEDKRGTLYSDRAFSTKDSSEKPFAPNKSEKKAVLESVVFDAFKGLSPVIKKQTGVKDWVAPKTVTIHSSVKISGDTYSSNSNSPSSFVFLKSVSKRGNTTAITYWPSDIHEIFSVPHPANNDEKLYFLLLKSYVRASTDLTDPFLDFPDFGVSLWRNETISKPFVVQVTAKMEIWHGIKSSWNKDHIITKPLRHDF